MVAPVSPAALLETASKNPDQLSVEQLNQCRDELCSRGKALKDHYQLSVKQLEQCRAESLLQDKDKDPSSVSSYAETAAKAHEAALNNSQLLINVDLALVKKRFSKMMHLSAPIRSTSSDTIYTKYHKKL